MNLSKRQVKALLEVMSKDESRPIITQLYIDEYDGKTVAVATDGYQLVVLDTELDSELRGQAVQRDELVKWYKLANTKDRFIDDNLVELAGDSDGNYPEWQRFVAVDVVPIDTIALNANYMMNMQQLNDGEALCYKPGGRLAPHKAISKVGTFVIMPLK